MSENSDCAFLTASSVRVVVNMYVVTTTKSNRHRQLKHGWCSNSPLSKKSSQYELRSSHGEWQVFYR